MAKYEGMHRHLEKALGDYYQTLSSDKIDKINKYYDCLIDGNSRMNLTRIIDEEGVAKNHYADSIFADKIGIIKSGDQLIDVGSGAGFPGVPLAIVNDDIFVTCLEVTKKKADFIAQSCETCGIEMTVLAERAEEACKEPQHRYAYDVCVSRAVGKLNILMELCSGFVKMGGYFLAFKGSNAHIERKEAEEKACSVLGFEYVGEHKFENDSDHTILVYQRVKKMNDCYPRRFGNIKKRPL
jgi:16S rRNA (guanine527-N7)-methyltransferase